MFRTLLGDGDCAISAYLNSHAWICQDRRYDQGFQKLLERPTRMKGIEVFTIEFQLSTVSVTAEDKEGQTVPTNIEIVEELC